MIKIEKRNYYTRAEIAPKFNVSPQAIYKWQRQGCPCVLVNRTGFKPTWFFNISDLEEWRLS